MIIQIRGTSGSGKTTAMRAIMEALPKLTKNPIEPQYVEGRRNPLYYTDGGCVSILGSYESTCGGVDTIHGYEQLQKLVKERVEDGGHVLMEGLLLSEDSKQTIQMSHIWREIGREEGFAELRVIYLTTPLETCLERIRGRREKKGNDKPLNVENTTRRVGVIERSRVRLEEAGILCRSASDNQTPRLVLNWLRESK